MTNYEVYYDQFTVLQTTPNFNTDGCSCIFFENIGDDNVTINGNIPLSAGDPAREFNNMPYEKIFRPFSITFSGTGVAPKLLVIRKFTKIIK